jgi:hypothetical protein
MKATPDKETLRAMLKARGFSWTKSDGQRCQHCGQPIKDDGAWVAGDGRAWCSSDCLAVALGLEVN